jgi:hypothetical protein
LGKGAGLTEPFTVSTEMLGVVIICGKAGISLKNESLSCEGVIMEVIVEWYIECFCSAKFSGGFFLENFFEGYCVDRKGLDG